MPGVVTGPQSGWHWRFGRPHDGSLGSGQSALTVQGPVPTVKLWSVDVSAPEVRIPKTPDGDGDHRRNFCALNPDPKRLMGGGMQ